MNPTYRNGHSRWIWMTAFMCTVGISWADDAKPAAAPLASALPATQTAGARLVTQGLSDGKLTLAAGRSTIISTARPYKRLAIPDAEIAAVKALTADSFLVTPRKAGASQLIVWDERDQAQMIDLVVTLDTQALQSQINKLFPEAKVEVSAANASLVLRGRVPSAEVADRIEQVAKSHAEKLLNFLEVTGGQQVMLHVRFAEVSRSATSALGVNLFAADSSFVGGSNIGQINPISSLLPGNISGSPSHTVSPSVTIFSATQIGSVYLETFVQALRENNLLRILAEPNLLTMSGKEAEFLAGGSFPIPVSGGGETGGSTAVTVEFREFGVKLKFTPVVMGDGRIRLQCSPEVSDLDFTTAVRFNGFVVPGLSQRRVSTTIELAEGQTFAIAGLLNNTVAASKQVTPLLGDLPVVGSLFRSVRYQRKETELIVLVTPRLVAPMNPGQVPTAPGQDWRHPAEKDLFLKQDLGGPAKTGAPATRPATTQAPPQYFGPHGFNPVASGPAGSQE